MFLRIALASLLLATPALAEPPAAPPAVLSAYSDWLVGHWTHHEDGDMPGYGPGRMVVTLDLLADGRLDMTGTFTPYGVSAPVPELGGRMAATWRMEDAGDPDLRVRLDNVLVADGTAPLQPDPDPIQVMHLVIGVEASLYDPDLGIIWTREETPTLRLPPPSP